MDVQFVGKLNVREMISYHKKSNLFINPSIMEVHALSLREALTMGVPSISSLCGSVNEYLDNDINGLIYRYEEHEVLAFNILKILDSPSRASQLGKNAKDKMMKINRDDKSIPLMEIYRNILSD
jgi:glycosyltransferase involved in cell wall biosynthesis